jgi:CheY-specific phosphatase CheX
MVENNTTLAIDTKENLLSGILGNIVQDATVSTFAKAFVFSPSYEDSILEPNFNNLIGIISFVGTLHWVFMLEIPKETALFLSNKFIGIEVPFESEDMVDLIGELINLVAGTVSTNLEKIGMKAQMSVPTVAKNRSVVPVLEGLAVLQDKYVISNYPFATKVVILTEHSVSKVEKFLKKTA